MKVAFASCTEPRSLNVPVKVSAASTEEEAGADAGTESETGGGSGGGGAVGGTV